MTPAGAQARGDGEGTTALLWVLVCAICPLFTLGFFLTLNRPVPRSHAEGWLILVGLIGSLAALVLLQWAVLRRVAPRLPLLLWFAGMGFAGIAWLLWSANAPDWLGPVADVRHGARGAAPTGVPYIDQTIALAGMWGWFVLAVALRAAVAALVPAWILGSCSGTRPWIFLSAAVTGACAAAVMQRVYTGKLTTQFISWFDDIPAPIPRASDVVLHCAVGAMWGAASALGFLLLSRHPNQDGPARPVIAVMLGTAAAAALAPRMLAAALG